MACPICGEDFCKFDFHPKHEREKAEKAWAEHKRRFDRYPQAIAFLEASPHPPWDEEDIDLVRRIGEFLADEPAPEPESKPEPVETMEDRIYYFQRDMDEYDGGEL